MKPIETNPRPQKEKIQYLNTEYLSCWCWNVNSLIAHKISMLSQLECICISKTFFDSSIQEGDKNIQLDGYNLLRVDHPSNSKRGSVFIFYKETLSVHNIKSLSLNEFIIC